MLHPGIAGDAPRGFADLFTLLPPTGAVPGSISGSRNTSDEEGLFGFRIGPTGPSGRSATLTEFHCYRSVVVANLIYIG